jgi:hypothetical protein
MVNSGRNGRWQTRGALRKSTMRKREREEHLKRAIHRLPPVLRNLIELQHIYGGSIKEISELGGISVAATRSRLLRARKMLRRSLAWRQLEHLYCGLDKHAYHGRSLRRESRTSAPSLDYSLFSVVDKSPFFEKEGCTSPLGTMAARSSNAAGVISRTAEGGSIFCRITPSETMAHICTDR